MSEHLEDSDDLADAEYLRDLAERIYKIPVSQGVSGYDYDRLYHLAGKLDV